MSIWLHLSLVSLNANNSVLYNKFGEYIIIWLRKTLKRELCILYPPYNNSSEICK